VVGWSEWYYLSWWCSVGDLRASSPRRNMAPDGMPSCAAKTNTSAHNNGLSVAESTRPKCPCVRVALCVGDLACICDRGLLAHSHTTVGTLPTANLRRLKCGLPAAHFDCDQCSKRRACGQRTRRHNMMLQCPVAYPCLSVCRLPARKSKRTVGESHASVLACPSHWPQKQPHRM
jgi:hypothetical protein